MKTEKILIGTTKKDKLILVSGDIIKNSKDTEAIVNPNNKYMDYGCGVCGAIYDAAGIEKMENYWNLLEQYQQGEDIQTQITNAINNKREDIQEEQRSYLHEFIMNRLQTGVIYRIMENFSEANTYHSQWMEQQQILEAQATKALPRPERRRLQQRTDMKYMHNPESIMH